MLDVIFAGGGLASCLTAYRLQQRQPGLQTLIVEHAATLGGNHTWSFFPTDLTGEQRAWLQPLVVHRWPSYEVRFPGLSRRLTTGYCSTHSAHFHAHMMASIADRVRLDAPVNALHEQAVELSSGEVLEARCVIDGRGPQHSEHLALGYQKFTGRVLELRQPHGLEGPIIMDATVAQEGDYRFMYTLPLERRQLLVEDTRYSNSPALDGAAGSCAVSAYAEQQGWQVDGVIREESGVLPITLGGDIDAFWAGGGIPRIGLRAALFHATTGYSFADAVRTADVIAAMEISSTAAMFDALAQRSKAHWRRQAYWRLLNRMLFIAAEPDRRHVVMERFYRLRQPLIERFYAGQSNLLDKIRILTGRPPVAILPALRCLPQSSVLTSERS